MNAAASTLATALVALYPFAVFLGARRFGARAAAALVIAFSLAALLARGRRATHLRSATVPVLGGLVLAVIAAAVGDHRTMLAQPVLVNALFLLTFAASLRANTSMCERFARLRVPDLSPAEVAYCRSLTGLWCLFFVANGAAAALLALAAPLAWWGLYTGFVSYLLIGAFFGIEYLVRRRRFPHRYGSAP